MLPMTAATKAKAHWAKRDGPLPSPPTGGGSIMSCISKRSPLTTRPSPLPSPRVAMGIAPLIEQRLTFSQSSRDSIRHKGGEWLQPTCAHISKQDGTTQCDAIFIYVCTSEGGVLSVLSPQSVFLYFWIVGGIFPVSHLLNPFAVRNSHILSMKV